MVGVLVPQQFDLNLRQQQRRSKCVHTAAQAHLDVLDVL
jgi:hypothetical protein